MRNNQGFTEDSTHWPKVGMWPLASSVGISVVGCGLPMRRKMWKPGLHAAPLPGEAPSRDIVLLPLGYLSSVLQLSPGLILTLQGELSVPPPLLPDGGGTSLGGIFLRSSRIDFFMAGTISFCVLDIPSFSFWKIFPTPSFSRFCVFTNFFLLLLSHNWEKKENLPETSAIRRTVLAWQSDCISETLIQPCEEVDESACGP